ncbi:MAG: molybdenum cofactor guanylyltransferase [Thermoplasmata archaeon]|nr:molybdenum cofactor guanylyltransferase [Thermoplasmata archaeon]
MATQPARVLPGREVLETTMVIVSGLILAGGSGRRVGAFKPDLKVGGLPLVLRVLSAVRPLAQEIVVVYGPETHRHRLEALVQEARFVGDEGEGPLGGLFRGAEAARGDWILVAPADAPFLSSDLYGRLLEEAQGGDGCLLPADPKVNPLIAAYRRLPLLKVVEPLLSQGERAAHAILPHLRLAHLTRTDLAAVPFGAHSTFDVDTEADLERAEEILEGRGDVDG